MTILETAIIFKGETLCETQFYTSEELLSKETRNYLLNAVLGLADAAFKDEIQNFSLGNHTILLSFRYLDDYEKFDTETGKNDTMTAALLLYCIVEKKNDEKLVRNAMNDALAQFIHRYSTFDIIHGDRAKFTKYSKRLEKIFKDLALKSEDRFKNLF